MSQARYACKNCGAESPPGIGYVLRPGEKPTRQEPDPACLNPHVKDTAVLNAIKSLGVRLDARIDALSDRIDELSGRLAAATKIMMKGTNDPR